MASAEQLPKQDLLAKLLRMTASPNDGEALTAIRKANALLSTAGWDWDKLIAGKITVVADPFASVATPKTENFSNSQPKAPPRPQPPPTAPWRAPPPPTRQPAPPPHPTPPTPYSTRSNNYGGWCWCCGVQVPSQSGFIFKPADARSVYSNSPATLKWQIVCEPCNKKNAYIGNSAAHRQTISVASPDLYTL